MSTRVAGAVSGGMAALALPPFGMWPLVFVALVPLALSLSRSSTHRPDAVAGGLWFGLVFYGTLLHWLPFTLQGILPFGAVLGCLAVAVLAGTGGVQAIVLRHLLVERARLPIFAVPAVWVTTEVVLAHAGPLAMPWTPLGLSMAAQPALAGSAEWIGVHGLSLWIAVVNGGAVGVRLALRKGRAFLPVGVTLFALCCPALAGVVRDRALETRELPSVLATQIHIPRDGLLDPDARDRNAAQALTRVLAPLGRIQDGLEDSGGIERPVLVILPEAPFGERWGGGLQDRMHSWAEELGVPILVGAHVADDPAPGAGGLEVLRNALLLVEPAADARLVHGKIRLVPGVESPGLSPGPAGGVLRIGALNVGLAICFESAFGRDIRKLRKAGAELLVNPTNDGWFRPSIPGRGSAAHAQHRAHLVLRAIETRMSAVRSSLGGELLAIGPDGRVTTARAPGAEGVAVITPTVVTAMSAYVRYGEVGGLAGVLLFVILLLSGRRVGKPTTGPG